jgi:hypothetical protein
VKSRLAFIVLVIIGLFALPLVVGAQDVGSMRFTCDTESGASVEITNAIPVTIRQLRAGFDYTATAVGINGFDPVLAVLGESGDGLCSDDAPGARRYAADLPTTGVVSPSNLSSQVIFNHSDSSGFQDIDLVVGGLNGQTGEFLLILEGMGVTAADNAGDPFLVTLTESMVGFGVLDVYMLTRGRSGVDPLVYMPDADGNVMTDRDGLSIICDDAGNPDLCYGNSVRLDNYSVTINTGTLPGWEYDAYITLDVSGITLSDDPDDNVLTFLMTSYQGRTEGQYLVVFRMGIGESNARPGK